MAYFAEIDENNIVKQVVVIPDEQEYRGQVFLSSDLKLGGRWVKTSYDHKFRKQYAEIGFSYNEASDVFVAPKPFPSWTLNESHDWQAPKPKPEGNMIYSWNEEILDWDVTDRYL
jgi:hypothetical protein